MSSRSCSNPSAEAGTVPGPQVARALSGARPVRRENAQGAAQMIQSASIPGHCPQHNEPDYAAWTASIDHIRVTPGFSGRSWPREMSLDDNLRDLERHARDFAGRRGFTYTVLGAGTGDVIGCVYIYPPSGQQPAGAGGGARPSGPGCGPTAPRSTRSSTTQSSPGWNAIGRSTRSSTPRGPEPRRLPARTCRRRSGPCWRAAGRWPALDEADPAPAVDAGGQQVGKVGGGAEGHGGHPAGPGEQLAVGCRVLLARDNAAAAPSGQDPDGAAA